MRASAPPPANTSAFSSYGVYDNLPLSDDVPNSNAQKKRQDMLNSMRKHRSLDNTQFLNEFEDFPYLQQHSQFPTSSTNYGASSLYDNVGLAGTSYGYEDPPPGFQNLSANPTGFSYLNDPILRNPRHSYSTKPAATLSQPWSYQTTSQYGSNMVQEYEAMKQEYMALHQKLNYVMNSIRTFWSPELKKERQVRKEEALRLNTLQTKISQQAAELQRIQNELEKREKDVEQLLSETELFGMEEDLRLLRKRLNEPRDYTDKNINMHELQTVKTKMERSEMALSEKTVALANTEMRLKNAEDQKAALEKRAEILARSSSLHESQVQLLQEDLNVLRQKLETKNQQLETKEQLIKRLEQQMESMKNQIFDKEHVTQESEQRNANLGHRLDQLETMLRDREAELDRMKQRLLQQPGTRIENELRQQLENAEQDKRKLQENIDLLRKSAEAEKQQQLNTFNEENRQQRMTIEYLQKELSDRQILLSSQNEKISQLDNQLKSVDAKPTTVLKRDEEIGALHKELSETRNEVDRLLKIVQNLEKEKSSLLSKIDDGSPRRMANGLTLERKRDGSIGQKDDNILLKLRIDELEEALRESVGITAERDKLVAEQKHLIQQLTTQITELMKLKSDEQAAARALISMPLPPKDMKAELQKVRDEENLKYRMQLAGMRKETAMALIREKEACIKLLQTPPDQIRGKIEILNRQKDQLRHKLLTQDSDFSTLDQPTLGAAGASWMSPMKMPYDNALPPSSLVHAYSHQEVNGEDEEGIWA
uniref:Uncharacterized protein n=1 Tax=Acrobeloides nanus TaxID=290746 RepID=A0A914E5W9_9BILA